MISFINSNFWNVLASISTALGFIIIIWTAFVALGQLKEMAKVRHLEAMLQIFEMIGSKEARNHRRFIYKNLNDNPEMLSPDEWSIVEDVSVTFDRIGNLVEHELIPERELFNGHAIVIARLWIRLEPYIKYRRKRFDSEFVKHFEKLAQDAKKFYAKKYPEQQITFTKSWNNTVEKVGTTE